MNIASISKTAVDLVVSAGVGTIVGNAIKMSTPADTKTLQRISIAVGGFVLTGLVGSKAATYTGEQIDTTVTQVKAVKTAFHKKN